MNSKEAETGEISHPRMFPIMNGEPIPWVVIEPCERQAKINHGQSLQRLAQRGGLGCDEALRILTGQSFTMSCDPDAKRKLREIIKDRWYLPQIAEAKVLEVKLREALVELQKGVELFLAERMKIFPGSREVDDDLVGLAKELYASEEALKTLDGD